MTSLWDQISDNASLVTLPDIYLRLKDVLDDPDSCMADVVEVVGSDPALTARLLRIVNSAYFGLATEIDTVSRAINLLGTQEVHDLVLAVSVAQSFSGMSPAMMDVPRFWRRSFTAAVCAKELAKLCDVLDADRLFVSGLLSDIGHLFLYQYAAEQAQRAMLLASERGMPLFLVEREVLGIDYAQVGAELMRRWHLPQTLWEPTESHTEPARSQTYALATNLVSLAVRMAHAVDRGEDAEQALADVDAAAWKMTGLSPGRCAAILPEVSRQVNSVVEMFLPGAKAA
ncbi:MAG: HDOD domain-containing protein [Gammaproteobacteria bacterium]|nr:HDOD domain-containing protein [Gammaproteobacteria bacterium]